MKVKCADLKSCAHGSGRKGSTPLATIRWLVFFLQKLGSDAMLKQNTESMESRKCLITIYGNSYPAVVEKHLLIIHESNELFNKIVKRKYYLDKPLPFWKDGVFEIVQDDGLRLECYMSDDRMRLIEL